MNRLLYACPLCPLIRFLVPRQRRSSRPQLHNGVWDSEDETSNGDIALEMSNLDEFAASVAKRNEVCPFENLKYNLKIM